jgi:hypothetical protein
MAKKRKHKKQEKQYTKSNIKVWKTLAIACVVIFCIIVLVSLVKVYHFKSSFTEPTEEQITTAEALIAQAVEQRGDVLDDYEIKVRHRMRKTSRNQVLQVSLQKEAVHETFLVDLGAEEIVMHSKTESFGWMIEVSKERRDWKGKSLGKGYYGGFRKHKR